MQSSNGERYGKQPSVGTEGPPHLVRRRPWGAAAAKLKRPAKSKTRPSTAHVLRKLMLGRIHVRVADCHQERKERLPSSSDDTLRAGNKTKQNASIIPR